MSKMLLFQFLLVFLFPDRISAQAGTLDASFGTGGELTIPVNEKFSAVEDFVIQPNGRLLIAATNGSFQTSDILLVRLYSDGTLDHSFGYLGKAIINIGERESVSGMVLQEDRRIVVYGNLIRNDSVIGFIIRFEGDGTRDLSFGNDGIVEVAKVKNTFVNTILIQENGKLLCAGSTGWNGWVTSAILFRLNPDGSPDKDFQSGGIFYANYPQAPNSIFALIQGPEGGFFTAGPNGKIDKYSFEVNEFNQYGVSGWGGFGKDGFVITNVKENYSKPIAVAILRDSQILAAGFAGQDENSDFAFVRYLPDGKIDKVFGGGIRTDDVSSNGREDILRDFHLLEFGSFLALGSSHNGELDGTIPKTDLVLVQYYNDGSRDDSFGTAGLARISAEGKKYFRPGGMAIHPEGDIYVAGNTNSEFSKDIFVWKFKAK